MELFPVLFLIISLVASIVSSAKKEKEKQAARTRQAESAKRRAQTLQQMQQAAPKAAPVMPAMSFADVPGMVAAPTVHTHLQPDCVTHDAPGSLGVVSDEGKDPCHEEQLTFDRTLPEAAEARPALTFDWTGDSMVKAVVMSEILTRPQQRRAR